MNKKASLSLSITAIVVIVIAFVVLGLGLGLTKTIFGKGESELIKAFDITELEKEPTSSDPITISSEFNIDRKESKTLSIGFYNKGEGSATGAAFTISGCLKGGEEVADNLPTIDSVPADVGPSEGKGYSIIFYENGLPAGTYICTIGVQCTASTCPTWIDDDNFYEREQFFLKVIA